LDLYSGEAVLEELKQGSQTRMQKSVLEATRKKYEGVFLELEEFLEKFELPTQVPIPVDVILAFLEFIARTSTPGVAVAHGEAIKKVLKWRGAPLSYQEIALMTDFRKAAGNEMDQRYTGKKVDAMPLVFVKVVTELAENFPMRWWTVATGFLLGIRTAQRAASLAGVKLKDLTFLANGQVKVFYKKFKTKPRGFTVWIEPSGKETCVVKFLKRLVKMRKEAGAGDDDLLFLTRNGHQTGCGYWSKQIKKVQEEAEKLKGGKYEGKFSSRSFRITAVTLMVAMGFTEGQIKATGGWLSECDEVYVRQQGLIYLRISAQMIEMMYLNSNPPEPADALWEEPVYQS
jgi:hypothetical protein